MTAQTGRERFARMRSILEVPILNEKFWARVPTADADAIMVDLEDSATPGNKEIVRERVVEALGDLAYFGGRQVIVRVNNLSTPWGHDDLAALAGVSGDVVICYPKVETVNELEAVADILQGSGICHELHVMIETARSIIELAQIASFPGVVGLHFGYVDYAADTGSRAFDDDGLRLFHDSTSYVRPKIAAAAAAYGLFATGGTLIPDYRDLEKVRRFVKGWADAGFTACIAVSPTHLPIVNEVMAPSHAEVIRARLVCEAYEESIRQGEPAAILEDRVITMPDYRVASLVLARSREEAGAGPGES